ncbi:MAG: hypothetical protein Q9211_005212 [Gyalolechia sp. 1 TL-2023]
MVRLMPQHRDLINTVPVDDLLESPPIHVYYRFEGNSPPFQMMLNSMSPSVLDEQDAIGETLLFKAIRCRDLALVRQLVEYGACVIKKNLHGYEPISIACSIGDISIVGCLLDHGANPMAGNLWNSNSNALCYAVGSNRHDIICLLLDHQSWSISCDRQRQNQANVTKLHYAACYGDVQTLQTLSKVRWITNDVQKLVNGMDKDVWTPRTIIEARRFNRLAWGSGNAYSSKEKPDPEKAYEAFMGLVQKIVGDHHEVGEDPSSRLCGPPRQCSMPDPGTGIWRWNICTCEQDSTSEQNRTKSENLETDASKSDMGPATAVPKPSTQPTSADTQMPRTLEVPQNDPVAELILSEVHRDEFKWVSLGLWEGIVL